MKNISYNYHGVTSVQIHDEHPARFFRFKKEVKFLGIIWVQQGLYDLLGNFVKSPEDVFEKHFFINGKLFEKPEVLVTFSDGQTYIKTFDTVAECEKYRDKVISRSFMRSCFSKPDEL